MKFIKPKTYLYVTLGGNLSYIILFFAATLGFDLLDSAFGEGSLVIIIAISVAALIVPFVLLLCGLAILWREGKTPSLVIGLLINLALLSYFLYISTVDYARLDEGGPGGIPPEAARLVE